MKYLTREWYVKARLSYIDGSVCCSKLAEGFNELFYTAVYQKRYERFERNERLRDEFRNPQEDLKKYDAWINEPNISQEEKEKRIEHKKITLFLERERFETGKYYQYDELMLQRIYRKDGNVFLVFDSGTLKVVNGEIIEREEKRLYHYKRKR